jgi:hypothetical protein
MRLLEGFEMHSEYAYVVHSKGIRKQHEPVY